MEYVRLSFFLTYMRFGEASAVLQEALGNVVVIVCLPEPRVPELYWILLCHQPNKVTCHACV